MFEHSKVVNKAVSIIIMESEEKYDCNVGDLFIFLRIYFYLNLNEQLIE